MGGFGAHYLSERLTAIAAGGERPSRCIIAFSGGLDSMALLHAASQLADPMQLLAVHVDHGLQPQSADWARRAAELAACAGVAFIADYAKVDTAEGRGAEDAARRARYGVLAAYLQPGDWLLTAHHRDDQAETLLLNLLRGAGTLGLAAMPVMRPLGAGSLVRPLLDVSRAELETYVRRHHLHWIDDPSNLDAVFDRNYLRHEILPRLDARWPAARANLARSASLAASAQDMLDALAQVDLAGAVTTAPDRLSVARLLELDSRRLDNALRYTCRRLGLPLPPPTALRRIAGEVLDARDDANPLVAWEGAEVRRYRNELFVLGQLPESLPPRTLLTPGRPLALGRGLGTLALEATPGPAIGAATAEAGLAVAYRRGGERLRTSPEARRQRLKALFQSRGVLPWMRRRVPLLYADDVLVAVADLWIEAGYQAETGYRVVWHDPPSIF